MSWAISGWTGSRRATRLPRENRARDAASVKDNTLGKKILVAITAIAVAIGLFFLNRHRGISPGAGVANIAKHPLAPEFSLPELTGQTMQFIRGDIVSAHLVKVMLN